MIVDRKLLYLTLEIRTGTMVAKFVILVISKQHGARPFVRTDLI